jgi:hypothetical protein
MGMSYSTHVRDEICIQNFSQKKPTGKGTLGRPRGRWKFNITIDTKEVRHGKCIIDRRPSRFYCR